MFRLFLITSGVFKGCYIVQIVVVERFRETKCCHKCSKHTSEPGAPGFCIYTLVLSSSQVSESPLVAVMSHLLSFLEQYSHLQQLQQQADQYRVQLRRHRVQHRRHMKALRTHYRQRLRDKNSIISSLEEVISQQPTPTGEGERGGAGQGRVEGRGWGSWGWLERGVEDEHQLSEDINWENPCSNYIGYSAL